MRDIIPHRNKENVNKTPSRVTVKTTITSTVTPQHSKSTSESSSRYGQKSTAGSTRQTPLGSGIQNNPFIVRSASTKKHGAGETPGKFTRPTPVRNTPMTPSVQSIGRKSDITPVSRKLNLSVANLTSKSDHGEIEESHVTVAVRIRPLNQREKVDNNSVVVEASKDNVIKVADYNKNSGCEISFDYDHCFGPTSTQTEIFRSLVHPLLTKALEGYNACLFSYGQTGSGKTYSMIGVDNMDNYTVSKEAGIIPRFGFSLFEKIKRMEVNVEISYFEIYKEVIRDLLAEDQHITGYGKSKTVLQQLKVREHPQLGPYVENLSCHPVSTFEELQGWLRIGLNRRAIANSAMNDKSSRSHCIFTVTLTHRGDKLGRRSKVHLVDLAGSERVNSTGATGDRLKEGVSINVSLLTLGKVITALTEKQKPPYRESLITWLLSDSLGGSARTVMLATVSPSSIYYEETLATLRYACQARSIVNKPHIQHVSTVNASHRQLMEEVERLRAAERRVDNVTHHEIDHLQTELESVQRKLEEERLAWQARLANSERARAEQTAELLKRGVSDNLTSPGICLLTSDPSLYVTFALPDKHHRSKLLGCQQPPADIELQGPLISEEHCRLEWRDGVIWLIPLDPISECYVNGALIESEVPLSHGDRLALGGEFFLLVQLKPDQKSTIDYEFARMELSLAQNTRLNQELIEAKENAILELQETRAELEQIGADKRAAETELLLVKEEQSKIIQALTSEIKAEKQRNDLGKYNLDNSLVPFASTLLQEIENMSASFSLNGSNNELGLHEMRCLVREASLRCSKLGLLYRFNLFKQLQEEITAGKPILNSCIKIFNGSKDQVTQCSVQDFMDILDIIRSCQFEDGDINAVNALLSQLPWESSTSTENKLETRITVDVTPFKRHMLSLSLTVQEEEEEGEVEEAQSVEMNNDDKSIEKYLSDLHEALNKIKELTQDQSNLEPYIKSTTTSICQLERAILHPNLVEQCNNTSMPSSISRTSSLFSFNNNNRQSSFDHTGLSLCSNGSSIMPHQSTMINSVDLALDNLRQSTVTPNESSINSGSTILHSPPSLSAQPTKSNLKDPTNLPSSPSKEVRFHFKQKR